jgi:hypothetical protein
MKERKLFKFSSGFDSIHQFGWRDILKMFFLAIKYKKKFSKCFFGEMVVSSSPATEETGAVGREIESRQGGSFIVELARSTKERTRHPPLPKNGNDCALESNFTSCARSTTEHMPALVFTIRFEIQRIRD